MGDELVANGSSRDGGLVPAQSVVESLVGSEALQETGVEFRAVDDVEEGRVYRLEIPGESNLAWLESLVVDPAEGTLADEIMNGEDDVTEVAITFDHEVFDQYPSVRLFSFGDRLFDAIIEYIVQISTRSDSTDFVRFDRNGSKTSNGHWVVGGWISQTNEDNTFTTDQSTIRDWLTDKIELEAKLTN